MKKEEENDLENERFRQEKNLSVGGSRTKGAPCLAFVKGQNTSSRNEPTTTKTKSGIEIIIFSYPSVATLRRRCNSRSSPQETTTSIVSFCWMGWSSGRSDYDGQRTWWLGSSDTTTTSKTIISRFNFFCSIHEIWIDTFCDEQTHTHTNFFLIQISRWWMMAAGISPRNSDWNIAFQTSTK